MAGDDLMDFLMRHLLGSYLLHDVDPKSDVFAALGWEGEKLGWKIGRNIVTSRNELAVLADRGENPLAYPPPKGDGLGFPALENQVVKPRFSDESHLSRPFIRVHSNDMNVFAWKTGQGLSAIPKSKQFAGIRATY